MGTGKLSEKPDEMLGVTCDGIAFYPWGEGGSNIKKGGNARREFLN